MKKIISRPASTVRVHVARKKTSLPKQARVRRYVTQFIAAEEFAAD
jgi:hypothetical protein